MPSCGSKYYKSTENMSSSIQPIHQNRCVLGELLNTKMLAPQKNQKPTKQTNYKTSEFCRYADRTCCHPKNSELVSQSPQVNGFKDLWCFEKFSGLIVTKVPSACLICTNTYAFRHFYYSGMEIPGGKRHLNNNKNPVRLWTQLFFLYLTS